MARISGLIFDDNDANGIFNSFKDNTPSGKRVELLDGNGNIVAVTTTDGDGRYSFNNLGAGDYQVQFFLTGLAVFSPQNVGNNDSIDSDVNAEGRTDIISLGANDSVDNIDAGCYKLSRIGDLVFEDNNGNGIQDDGETGVSDVVVELLAPDGTVLDTVATNENGNYEFLRLPAGEYKVKFIRPDGFESFTNKDAGDNDAIDSDADANGVTDVFGIPFGDNKTTIDAGLIKTFPPAKASLGDRVFFDANQNGIQDDGESGVANVVVRLQSPDGQTIETTATDDNGFYLFDNLNAGDYKITVVQPGNFDGFTVQNAGDDDSADSDINPDNRMSQVVNLSPGEDDRSVDAGLIKTPPPAKASLGDRVFNDLNRDGFQDPNEPGVSDVPIRLQSPDGTEIATTITDDNGNYLFNNLDPGRYKITVVKPDGFEFTQRFATVDGNRQPTIDSNIDPNNGMSNIINLNPGARNLTVDAGLVEDLPPKASLGDRVFNDLNENGIQDEGEPGISGASIILQNSGGDTLSETTTNDDGFYSFDDLAPGSYKVTFEQPDGFNSVSPFLAGGDRSIDSNANPNNGLMSQVFNLAAGEVNNTIDAGFFNKEVPVNPDVDIEKLVRVEAEGTEAGIDLCDEFGDPIGLIFEYIGGSATNQTGQGGATVTGPTINDPNVDILSTVPGDPIVIIPGGGKGKGKSKGGKGKAGKGKGGVLNPFPPTNPNPAPEGTPVALGETFIVRPETPDVNIEIEGANGTQEISYDVTCNSPIQLGDVIGGLRLVGYQGTNGSTRLAGSSTGDIDADNAPGADAIVGDNIVFTYVARNTGDTAIGNVRVTDDRVNPSFVNGDNNGNGLLDVGEEWIYTASETAGSGLRTNTGTINGIAIDGNGNPILVGDGSGNPIGVSDSDPANYTGGNVPNPIEIPNTEITPPPPPISGDLCDTLGKPISLTFLYEPSNEINTAQEKFDIEGFADDDNIAFVVGGGKGKGGKGKGGITGTGQRVNSGDTFTIGVDGSNTNITVLDDQGGPALQSIDYHTSCSDIIQLGDQIGSITLVGYNGENGSTSLTEEQIDDLFGQILLSLKT